MSDQKGHEEIKQHNLPTAAPQTAQFHPIQQPKSLLLQAYLETTQNLHMRQGPRESSRAPEHQNFTGMNRITDFFGSSSGGPLTLPQLEVAAQGGNMGALVNSNEGKITDHPAPDEKHPATNFSPKEVEVVDASARVKLISEAKDRGGDAVSSSESQNQQPDAKLYDERQSTDASSSPAQNHFLGQSTYHAAEVDHKNILGIRKSPVIEENGSGIQVDQELAQQLSSSQRSHNNQRSRKGSDRLEKSPAAVTASLDRSDKKTIKSRETSVNNVTANNNGQTGDFGSQSFHSNDGKMKVNRDYCNVCKKGGKIVCCDHCPRSFHIKCLGKQADNSLGAADNDGSEWFCPICKPQILKRRAQEEDKRRKLEERERQIELKLKKKEEEERLKNEEAEKKREEKRREKERLEEEKRLIKEKQEEEKRREREAQLEAKRQKEEELAELKRQKEAALAEIKAKKEAELAEQKRIREEALLEARKKREEEEAERKRKREEELAEQKRKREETLAAAAEAKRLREAALAEAKAKALADKLAQSKSKQGGGGGSQQSHVSGEEDKKDSALKAFAQKRAEEKSEAEKAKEARNREMRNQFKVFQKFYPELVEKHSIKYPIEDKFIQLLPLLHGADKVPPKPQPKKILIDGVSFERVLYIWEFFTNFADFFNIATFKIEELQAALFLAADGQPLFDPPQNLAEGEEPDWEDYISNKTVIESGFGLVNSLMLAIVDCFFNEAKNNTEEKGAETKDTTNQNINDDQLLSAIIRYFEKGSGEQHHWPEFIRIILKSKRFSMHPLSPKMQKLCEEHLADCQPESFSRKLTYDQKLELLETLVDGLHDLNEFKTFLNQRIEERSAFNKQKMDIYSEIKQLEVQKAEILKENQSNNILSNSEQLMLQIEDLRKKLDNANRVESKRIQQQITDLENEKNKTMRELQKVEEQIEKRQSKIERLNEQANKTSIKNTVLGKDADRNEYWFFKEEPGKLFVKKFEPIQKQATLADDALMIDASASIQKESVWYYYDEEGHFDALTNSCNIKGIRERKLQENLKKLKERMKLKKGKRSKILAGEQPTTPTPGGQQTIQSMLQIKTEQSKDKQPEEQKVDEKQDEKKAEKIEEASDSESDDDEDNQEEDAHVLFQNDNYASAVVNAVWYGKKMPSKRQIMMENRQVGTRRTGKDQQQKKINLDERPCLATMKDMLANIESMYTDFSTPLNREWDTKVIRDKLRENIESAKTIEDLQQVLLRLDQGFSHPHHLRYKNSKEEEQEEEPEDSQQDSENSDDESEEEDSNDAPKEDEEMKDLGDENVKVVVLKLFKYWPSRELHSAWRDYVFSEVVDNNINALSIAVRILDRVNSEFLQRQAENQHKKAQREQRQYMQQQNISSSKPPSSSMKKENFYAAQTTGRSKKAINYKESEDENSDSGEEDQEDSNDQSSSKDVRGRGRPSASASSSRAAQQQPSSRGRGRGRPPKRAQESESEQDEEEIEDSAANQGSSSQDEEGSEEDDSEERSWDDRCYICRKAGTLICCEGCSHVAHHYCLGLKKPPEGEWHCEDCLIKMSQRRTTRGQSSKHQPAPAKGGRRSSSRHR